MCTTAGELKIPENYNKEFFEKVLNNKFKNNSIKLKNFEVNFVSNPGDNYCSEIYEIKLIYDNGNMKNQNISIIIKSMPKVQGRTEIIDDLRFYDKETEMYFQILPAISKLTNYKYDYADCYYATEDPYKIIVFEDLKSRGYKMADRKESLDFDHAKIFMEKIGLFHGSTMIYIKNNPQVKETFKFGMFYSNSASYEMTNFFFDAGIRSLIKVASKWKGYEQIVEKIKKIADNFFKIMETYVSIDRIPNCVKVLNHGDAWCNNLLFKYDSNNKPIDTILIDYQIGFYSSIGVDINYFFNTSLKLDVLKNQRNDLLKIYYNSLTSTLKSHNYSEIPTFQQILDDVRDTELYGFFSSTIILPMVLREECKENKGLDAQGLEALTADKDLSEKIRDFIYSGKRYEEAMKYLLKHFDEMKVLDVTHSF